VKNILPFIKKIITSEYLSLILRIYIGWIFIDASLNKILDPALFAENVANYRLIPYQGLNLVAIVLPWLELVCGFYLIIGIRTKAAVSTVGGLLFMFTLFVIINIFRGVNMNCGCFDTVEEPIGWTKVAINTCWLSMTIQIFFFDKISFFRRRRLGVAKQKGSYPASVS
jgi:putative oxidoreductase